MNLTRSDFRTLVPFLLGCLVFLPGTPCPGVEENVAEELERPDPAFSDAAIRLAVEQKLAADPAVFANPIETDVEEGIVTLRGTVENLVMRNRAVNAAKSRRGVIGVVDRLTVEPESRDDDAIREDVLVALSEGIAGEESQVKLDIDDGIVELTGVVRSIAERAALTRLVAGVRGVRDVNNRVAVVLPAEPDDEVIARTVRNRLDFDVWLAAFPLQVEVEDDEVTLSGTVSSLPLRDRAETLAGVVGARSVDLSGVTVEPEYDPVTDPKRVPTPQPEDDAIHTAIRAAWAEDPRVVAGNPDLNVEEGVVTLTGTVNNLKAKRAAEEDARGIVGVRQVDNFLKVHPLDPLANEQLEGRVKNALARNPYLGSSDIAVEARNGRIKLLGSVRNSYERGVAVQTAELVPGVTEVRQSLELTDEEPVLAPRVAPTTAEGEARLAEAIETEFRWSWQVDEKEVSVHVADGVAVLTGTVDTFVELEAAAQQAREAGAAIVRNEIEVETP